MTHELIKFFQDGKIEIILRNNLKIIVHNKDTACAVKFMIEYFSLSKQGKILR